MEYVKKGFTALVDLYKREPVRVTTFVVTAAVFVCARVGFVIDEQSLSKDVALVLPILLGGEYARSKVSPANDGSDDEPIDVPGVEGE